MSLIEKIIKNKVIEEYLLVLSAEERRISASIAKITDTSFEIIGHGESDFSEESDEVEAADIAVSTAEKSLPQNTLISKVIFGLPLTFLSENQIKPEYLDRLKKIAQELALKPLGFIEYSQAINYYLEAKEESPPNLLLLFIGRTKLTFSLIKAGKIEKNLIISRNSTFKSNFEEGISQFKEEILPSRIMLYGEVQESTSEEYREELLSFPWHSHSSFLHPPKIEILPNKEINLALVKSVIGSLQKELGFNIIPAEEKEVTQEENFGFLKQEDIALREAAPSIESTGEKVPPFPLFTEEGKSEEPLNLQSRSSSFRLGNIFSSFPIFSTKLFRFFPLLLFILVFLIIIGSISWFYPTTTVSLIVYPLSSTQKLNVTFTTDSNRTDNKTTLLATNVSEEVSGERTGSASGKTKIGESAKGEIIIYNKTTNGKIFPKGTTLTSGSLKFSLDSETHIASASETGEGLIFGKTTAKITALEIGPDGNLEAGNNFIFKDFSQSLYYAKNTEKLSGGTSRDISSISKDDQEKLLTTLSEEFKAQAKQKILAAISEGEKLLEESLKTSIQTKKFDKEIGSEAKDLHLSLTIKVSGLVFKESDLMSLGKESISLAPSGFIADNTRNFLKIEQMETTPKGEIKATGVITAYFLPEIDKEKIRAKITGKSYLETEKILSNTQDIGGVAIFAENSLPFLEKRLPWRAKNITILIASR